MHDQIQIQSYQVVRQQRNETKRRDTWSTEKQKPARDCLAFQMSILACGLLHRQAESGAGSAEMNHLKKHARNLPEVCTTSLFTVFLLLREVSPGHLQASILSEPWKLREAYPRCRALGGELEDALLPVSHQKHRPSALQRRLPMHLDIHNSQHISEGNLHE